MPFTFLQDTPGAANLEEHRLRFQIQAISDIYKAMQARLDGYRQSAGAVFLAVVAASLTFDSAFVRSFFDQQTTDPLRADPTLATAVVGGASGVVIVLCIASLWILKRISQYFAEMTSVVYKIDEANRVWDKDAWLAGTTLYPQMFRIDPTRARRHRVGRSARDRDLIGWHDPAIERFRALTRILALVHLVFYAGVHYSLWPEPYLRILHAIGS